MSLKGFVWYLLNSFLHVENVQQFLFLSRQNSGDEHWEVVLWYQDVASKVESLQKKHNKMLQIKFGLLLFSKKWGQIGPTTGLIAWQLSLFWREKNLQRNFEANCLHDTWIRDVCIRCAQGVGFGTEFFKSILPLPDPIQWSGRWCLRVGLGIFRTTLLVSAWIGCSSDAIKKRGGNETQFLPLLRFLK